jgi:lipopolysaccharide biosynthesis glycosyltransferase
MDVCQAKMNTSPFPILFATDAGYIPHLAVAMLSLLKNNQGLFLRIIIFTSRISEQDKYKLRNICEKFKTSLEFIQLDEKWFAGLKLNHHFQKSNYYRLFAADFIHDDKCLYLDVDIVVNDSISDIINIDLDEKYLAAVEDQGFNRHAELGMNINSKYFNCGIMLLNLKKWRSTNIKSRVISIVKKKSDMIHFVDQCGLNAVIDGKGICLDSKYNFQTHIPANSSIDYSTTAELPVIVHYTGSSKPWHMNYNNSYKKLYWHYRSQTPYQSFFPDDFSLLNTIRYIMPNFVKSFVKKIIGRKSV